MPLSRVDRLRTLVQVREYLAGDQEIEQRTRTRAEAYSFIERLLQRFDYFRLGRADKGMLRRLVARVTGLSRAQITRLLSQHRTTGQLADHRRATRRSFSRRYTKADVELLAELDTLHGTPSAPAARMLCARASHRFGDRRFQRLEGISNSHLYNLRRSTVYRRRREKMPDPSHPVPWTTGERWRPGPFEHPGHLRVVAAVRQKLPDPLERVYHLNLVDEVTQYQFVGAVEHIDPAGLAPILDALLKAFPFCIRGFHGGTQTRAARTVASILRSLHGAGRPASPAHPPDRYIEQVNAFARRILWLYLNYHRLRVFPGERPGTAEGRGRRRDADIMTPYDRLKSLPGGADCLKPGTTFTQLDAIASATSDNGAAWAVSEAGAQLLQSIGTTE